MENKRKTTLLIIIFIVIILIVGAVLALWNPAPPPPRAALPVPNGYTAFVQAGAQVQIQTTDYSTMNEVNLRSVVDANSNALQIARSGLAEKSRVPVEFSQAYISTHLSELSHLKMLMFAFLAEGKLAEMEHHTNDAARAYLDTVRVGVNSRNGGLLIDALVGMSLEGAGTATLRKVLPNLDAKTADDFARALEDTDVEKETWEQIRQDEDYWTRQMFSGLQYRVLALFTSSQRNAANAKTKNKYTAQQEQTRRLILDLAAQAYLLNKGNRPASAADLVPDYLKAAPKDPVTGADMKLSP